MQSHTQNQTQIHTYINKKNTHTQTNTHLQTKKHNKK